MNVEFLASTYDLPLKETAEALEKIKNREVFFLTVSGKFGAGKDSVAPDVMKSLTKGEVKHTFFAKHLKDEVNSVIELMKASDDYEKVCNQIILQQKSLPEPTKEIIKVLWDDVKSGVVQKSTDRTKSTRFALQQWGTEVRRAVDPNYWVKKSINDAIVNLSQGISIYVTDARFPNEMDAANNINGLSIRLLVSEEEQRKRIFGRDGITLTEEALRHPSETSLDSYTKFTSIINTDIYTEKQVIEKSIQDIKYFIESRTI